MRKIDHKSKYLLEEYRKAKELYLYYFKKIMIMIGKH